MEPEPPLRAINLSRIAIYPTNTNNARENIPLARQLAKPPRKRGPTRHTPPATNRRPNTKKTSTKREGCIVPLAGVLDDVPGAVRTLDTRHPEPPQRSALPRPADVGLWEPNAPRHPKQDVIVRGATTLHFERPGVRIRVPPTLKPLRNPLDKAGDVPRLPCPGIGVSQRHHN